MCYSFANRRFTKKKLENRLLSFTLREAWQDQRKLNLTCSLYYLLFYFSFILLSTYNYTYRGIVSSMNEYTYEVVICIT